MIKAYRVKAVQVVLIMGWDFLLATRWHQMSQDVTKDIPLF